MKEYEVKQGPKSSVLGTVRSLLIPILVLGVILLLVHTCVAPSAYFAVKQLCDEEGGIRIAKTASVDGYWYTGDYGKGFENDDCVLCKIQVARGDFSYVIYERKSATPNVSPGFVRFQLLSSGEPSCASIPHYVGVPTGKCVGALPLDGPPSNEYRFKVEVRKRKALLGVVVDELSRTIYDRNGTEPIATYNYFSYRTASGRSIQFAPSYSCKPPSNVKAFGEGEFLRTTLRSTQSANEKR